MDKEELFDRLAGLKEKNNDIRNKIDLLTPILSNIENIEFILRLNSIENIINEMLEFIEDEEN